MKFMLDATVYLNLTVAGFVAGVTSLYFNLMDFVVILCLFLNVTHEC